jgi:hypothetical protein
MNIIFLSARPAGQKFVIPMYLFSASVVSHSLLLGVTGSFFLRLRRCAREDWNFRECLCTHLRPAESEDIGRPAHWKANCSWPLPECPLGTLLQEQRGKSQVDSYHVEDGSSANGNVYAGHGRRVARTEPQSTLEVMRDVRNSGRLGAV